MVVQWRHPLLPDNLGERALDEAVELQHDGLFNEIGIHLKCNGHGVREELMNSGKVTNYCRNDQCGLSEVLVVTLAEETRTKTLSSRLIQLMGNG